MVDFRHMCGAVYILENSIAQRVKIGMSINNIAGRLDDVNDMWLERKVTCQICGKRSVNVGGQVPQHVVSGIGCLGGNAPPLEKNLALVERRFADAVLACELGHLHAGLPLLEHRNGLFFAESGLRHESSPVWKTLLPDGPIRQGVTRG